MAQKRIKFSFHPPSMDGHSLLKIVAFDWKGNPISIEKRYTFNGRLSPDSQKPQLHEKESEVEKGAFQNYERALEWANQLWQGLDKTNVAHGFIADADYPKVGKIWQQFQTVRTAQTVEQPYKYCLRVKLPTGKYWESRVTHRFCPIIEKPLSNWWDCLFQLAGEWNRFAEMNKEAAKLANVGMVFTDGKNHHTSTKDNGLIKIRFNPQTCIFESLLLHLKPEERALVKPEDRVLNYMEKITHKSYLEVHNY